MSTDGTFTIYFGVGAFLGSCGDGNIRYILFYPFLFMSDNDNHSDSLLDALSRLRLSHQQELSSIVQRQQREQQALINSFPTQSPSPPRSRSLPYRGSRPNTAPDHPVSSNSLPIHPGDSVRLLTKGKNSCVGDTAIVISKHDDGQWITIRIDRTGDTTTCRPGNLHVLL